MPKDALTFLGIIFSLFGADIRDSTGLTEMEFPFNVPASEVKKEKKGLTEIHLCMISVWRSQGSLGENRNPSHFKYLCMPQLLKSIR